MLSVYPHMVDGKETLAEFVKRVRREKKLSLSEVEAASKRRGGGISNGYISQIENGQNTNPSVSALKGLAAGLGVPEDYVFAVARGKTLEPITPTDFSSALGALGVESFDDYGGVESLTDDDRQEIVA